MKLASKLHISDIEHLTQELSALLESASDIELDASDVEATDTASLQAICALQKSLATTGSHINWTGKSKAFTQAADMLGVSDFLSLND